MSMNSAECNEENEFSGMEMSSCINSDVKFNRLLNPDETCAMAIYNFPVLTRFNQQEESTVAKQKPRFEHV